MAKNLLSVIILLWLSFPAGADSASDLRHHVREIYTHEIGVREKTNHNDGEPAKYLAYCGQKEGQEWCSAFVSWVFGQAGLTQFRTAWSPAWYDARKLVYPARAGKKPKHEPQAGDLVLYYIPWKHRIGHVGFFDKSGQPFCETVEGNTNVGGIGGVHRLKRYWKSFYAIVDEIGYCNLKP